MLLMKTLFVCKKNWKMFFQLQHRRKKQDRLISLRDSRRGNSRLRGFVDYKHSLNGIYADFGSICRPNWVRYIKIYQTWRGIGHNIHKIVSDTLRYQQNDDGYTVEVAQSVRPLVAILLIFARFFEVQLGWHRGNKGGKKRATERYGWKSHDQNRFYPNRFEVERVRFLM